MENKKLISFSSIFLGFSFTPEPSQPSSLTPTLRPQLLLRLGRARTKGYGIATPKGSIWRDKISLAILELQEKGTIQILYDKWWKNTGGKSAT